MKIYILNYGLGNIRSIYNAINKCGYKAQLISKDKKIECDILIIPGVGSFSEASKILNNKYKIILKLIKENKFFLLGICLGMQIMANKGNPNSVSDAGVAALCARSAVIGGYLNVKINCKDLSDKKLAKKLISEAEKIKKSAEKKEKEIINITLKKL